MLPLPAQDFEFSELSSPHEDLFRSAHCIIIPVLHNQLSPGQLIPESQYCTFPFSILDNNMAELEISGKIPKLGEVLPNYTAPYASKTKELHLRCITFPQLGFVVKMARIKHLLSGNNFGVINRKRIYQLY